MASGVAYLHNNGVIHRDIKAANVLLDDGQHAKVTDFGISTNFAAEHTAETGTYREARRLATPLPPPCRGRSRPARALAVRGCSG